MSHSIFVVEHDRGLVCCRLLRVDKKRAPQASELLYAQVPLEFGNEARLLGVVDLELRRFSSTGAIETPQIPPELATFWQPEPLGTERAKELGGWIRAARARSGLHLREASYQSARIAELLQDSRYFIARGSLSAYERLERPPRHIHKIFSLCALYGRALETFLEKRGLPLAQSGRDSFPNDLLTQFGSPPILHTRKAATVPFGSSSLVDLVAQSQDLPPFLAVRSGRPASPSSPCTTSFGSAEVPVHSTRASRYRCSLPSTVARNYRPTPTVKFKEFAKNWESKVLSQYGDSTAINYRTHIWKHLVPFFGEYSMKDLNPEMVQQFVSASAVGAKTTKNICITLQSMWTTANAWGYVAHDIMERVVLPAATRVQRFFLSQKEIQLILAKAQEPYRTWYGLAAETGLRVGELCGLAVDDIDIERGMLQVRQSAWRGKLGDPKTDDSTRVVELSPQACAHLKTFLKSWHPNERRLLFATRNGTPWDQTCC